MASDATNTDYGADSLTFPEGLEAVRRRQQVQPPAYGSDVPDASRARERRDHLVNHLGTQLMRGLATPAGQDTLRTDVSG